MFEAKHLSLIIIEHKDIIEAGGVVIAQQRAAAWDKLMYIPAFGRVAGIAFACLLQLVL
jgi:hypothetical protein